MHDTTNPLAGRRILILEDEYMIASEMEDILRRAGAEVDGPWPSVEQALAALDAGAGALQAGVLDINLGYGSSAGKVAERLDHLGVPYLFASGNSLDADNLALRGHLLLQKPVSARALLRAVEGLLAPAAGQPA